MSEFKKNIKKILIGTGWMVLAAGLVVLLVAAINKKNRATCKGIQIEIKGVGTNFFMDKQDVMSMIAPGGKNVFKGRSVASFNLQRLEGILETNLWVKDAELFFDNTEVLQVMVEEREPVARIFTTSGTSFYIDSSLERLPLSDKMSARLPVFTNFPSDKMKWRGADSLLMYQLKMVSLNVQKDPFLSAQVAQVDITGQRTFEIIPTIGSYVIELGDGEKLDEKFHRLMIFYQQVLGKTGFNKYARILLQYDKQVVGVRKGTVTKYDSLKVLKNIQQMIQASQKMQYDTLSTSVDKKIMSYEKADSPLAALPMVKEPDEVQQSSTNAVKNNPNNPSSVQRPIPSYDPAKKPVVKKPANEKPKAKAVMKKAGQ